MKIVPQKIVRLKLKFCYYVHTNEEVTKIVAPTNEKGIIRYFCNNDETNIFMPQDSTQVMTSLKIAPPCHSTCHHLKSELVRISDGR